MRDHTNANNVNTERNASKRRDSRLISRRVFWSSVDSVGDFDVVSSPKTKILRVPRRLSQVSSHCLGDLMARYAALTGYYDTMVARAEIDYAIARHNVGFLRAKLLLRARGRTIAERKAYRSVQRSLCKEKREMFRAKARYVLLLSYRRTAERYYQCVSREVSRRDAEFSRSRD